MLLLLLAVVSCRATVVGVECSPSALYPCPNSSLSCKRHAAAAGCGGSHDAASSETYLCVNVPNSLRPLLRYSSVVSLSYVGGTPLDQSDPAAGLNILRIFQSTFPDVYCGLQSFDEDQAHFLCASAVLQPMEELVNSINSPQEDGFAEAGPLSLQRVKDDIAEIERELEVLPERSEQSIRLQLRLRRLKRDLVSLQLPTLPEFLAATSIPLLRARRPNHRKK